MTGPLGPFIGGWFAGSRSKPNKTRSLLLGILMGLFMILPLGVAVVIEIIAPSIIPLSISHQHIATISIGVILYTGTLGTFGALLGSNMSRRRNPLDFQTHKS